MHKREKGNGILLEVQYRAIVTETEREVARILSNVIRQMILDLKQEGKQVTQNDFAKILGMSSSSFRNKMHRDTFTVNDAVKIAEHFDMKLIMKGKGKKRKYVIKKGD